MKRKIFPDLFCYMMCFVLSASFVWGQVPNTMSYQGVLTDAKGKIMTDGFYKITFKIYTDAEGGAPIWLESQSTEVKNGLFNVNIGSIKSLDLPFDRQYWLAIAIGEGEELKQRLELTSSAYSFSARSIADSIVTAKKIAKNQVVRSINSLTDAINLVPGENVTIVQKDSMLIISANLPDNNDQDARKDISISGLPYDSQQSENINSGGITTGVKSLNELVGHLQLQATGGASISTDGNGIITINAVTGDGTIAEIQNSDSVLDIINPNGPVTAIGIRDGGIVEAKLAESAVTTAKLAANAVTAEKIMDGTISTNDIADNAITEGKITPDIISSLNGITNDGGNIDLIAGTNVTITADDATDLITISSTSPADNDWTVTGANLTPAVTGNVGIGTAFPASKLEINATGAALRSISTNNIGVNSSGIIGMFSTGSTYGMWGIGTGEESNTGVYGEGYWGVYGKRSNAQGLAGRFEGDVSINGTLFKSAGAFKIDHPLDPQNKYLSHSLVESPDMMNIYNGNVELDSNGEAIVVLPDWFEALNSDFRYQLTAIGKPGPNLYVSEEIVGNQFRIAGGQAGMKISWQVTGVRKDAYAKAHSIQTEEWKRNEDRGKYLHPKEYGVAEENGIDYQEKQNRDLKLNKMREVK